MTCEHTYRPNLGGARRYARMIVCGVNCVTLCDVRSNGEHNVCDSDARPT
jgi:hypothetical protein